MELTPASDPPAIDIDALEADLNALRDRLRADAGPADLAHLRRMRWWNRLCFAAGYGTAWIAPNPISAFLISTGIFTRWAMMAHHVLHRGYDKLDGVPPGLTSKGFARGWRRWIDWPDWMHPATWRHEHNTLHHYKLGEVTDPDQPEHNVEFLRRSSLPRPLRYAALFVFSLLWKVYYYPTNSEATVHAHRQAKAKRPYTRRWVLHPSRWMPSHAIGRAVWLRSWLPYAIYRFGVLPLPFLLIGRWAWLAVLINSALAELMSNLHGFITIVTNHAGDDLYRFDRPIAGRGEFYLRQIVGSTNFTTGGDLNDFMHGWLNYQIEHHLWPDMSMLQYREAQPEVQAICARHGVPYVQQSVWRRVGKLLPMMAGDTSMRWWPSDQAPAASPEPMA